MKNWKEKTPLERMNTEGWTVVHNGNSIFTAPMQSYGICECDCNYMKGQGIHFRFIQSWERNRAAPNTEGN